MRARHNSRDAAYRTPFGAVACGGSVSLSVDIWDDPSAQVTCRLWVDGVGETFHKMKSEHSGDHQRFSLTLPCDTPSIVWYSFIIEESGGVVSHLGAPYGHTGGEGIITDCVPPSFQITVYEPRKTRPTWYEQAIVYQIYPDRFKRGAGWRKQVEAGLGGHEVGPTRVLVEDWDTPPTYTKDEQGRVTQWDFYGGTLRGIIEELPAISEMGFTAIYLNPIFEAASNHRYDTADYMAIDPILGTEADFRELCSTALEHGIRIILDGVFNHTGCDSRYFNKYGNYPDLGAYQSVDSPYRDWFHIDGDGENYGSWWGVGDLPDVEETNPDYRKFITGPDGVVAHWLKEGASAWRLDVADELPDEFIEEITSAALGAKPDAAVIGEVWEDASNKVAYSKPRRYLLGTELDGAMNYPFRTAFLDYLCGHLGAGDMAECMESLLENYPPEAFACSLNLLGSHDRTRLLTMLGDCPNPDAMSEQERYDYRMNDGQRSLAKSRLWIAALVQMCMPGVPSVFSGDEAGVEGLTDPCNRATYPWGHEDQDCKTIYRNAIMLRRSLDLFTNGGFEPFCAGDDVFGFWREGDGESVAVVINRSLSEVHDVSVRLRGEVVEDLIGGAPVEVVDGHATVTLKQLGSAVLYFHDASPIAKPLERGAGIFCHITSLPTDDGRPGTMGKPAFDFVDYLERCGIHYWQVLPVNPTDSYGSPYAGLSAFAGETRLLATSRAELRKRFDSAKLDADAGYLSFVQRNASWLDAYATFVAIHDEQDDACWQDWPAELQTYSPELSRLPRYAEAVEFVRYCQYEFDREWAELRDYAKAHGVQIIGDMPMYVSGDSSDVWSSPDMFRLDKDGRAKERAGAPPDQMSTEGQLWGNPTYNWDVMRADGYSWWLARLGRAFELYDRVRLDHFLGFANYYSIPEGATAKEGRWIAGPGVDLFATARRRFGPLPVICEDLGIITPAVRTLVAQGGFPGMDVLEFFSGDAREGYVPAPGKVAYTSTHDTQTLLGWVEDRYNLSGDEARTLADRLMCSVWDSEATVSIMPLQDALGQGDESRMNVPGVAEGNWRWQADAAELEKSVAFLQSITREARRS